MRRTRDVKWFAPTLWDLVGRAAEAPRVARAPATRRPNGGGMRARYDALVVDMKREYGVRIRKWRSSTSGCAWELHDRDGGVTRMIEAPRPRGPMSCAVFLHEVGHHAIGFGRYRPRCLEEYHAWRWALDAMRERGFNVTPAVERRMRDALRYAIWKAARRGLRRLPAELEPYLEAEPAGAGPGSG